MFLNVSPIGPVSPVIAKSVAVALGIIYDKTLGDNISDWTVVNPSGGVSMTPSGPDYIMAGTNGTGGVGASDLFQDYVLLNQRITCLREWDVRIRFKTGSSINVADSYGFSCGVISSNDFEFRDSLSRMAQDSGGVFGGFYFYYGDASSTGINNQTSPGGGYSLAADTIYEVRFNQSNLTFTSTLYQSDGTTVLHSNTTTDSPPGGTMAKVHHNTGKFAIAQHGGTNTIMRVTISSDALKNVDYACLTDSLGYGGKATTISDGFIYQALDGYNFTNLAGWANRAEDMEVLMAEVKSLNPKNVIIEVGSNDIKDGTWASVGEGKLDDMIAYIGTNMPTAKIYLVSAGARNDVDVSQVETDMLTKVVDGVCRAFTITKQPANTMLLGAYNSGDGIHWLTLGHTDVATDATYGLKETLGIAA